MGHTWNPTDDTIAFRIVLNLHKKQGAKKTGPDLTLEDLQMIQEMVFTKRISLGLSAQVFDPMGLVVGFSAF